MPSTQVPTLATSRHLNPLPGNKSDTRRVWLALEAGDNKEKKGVLFRPWKWPWKCDLLAQKEGREEGKWVGE